MDEIESVRNGERAGVERWFPPGPLGRLFDPGDGRMLPIREDAAAEWRAQGFAIVDRFVFDAKRWHPEGMLVLAVAVLGSIAALHFHHGAAIPVLIGLGMAALHGLGLLRLRRYRRELADLRARIRASLAASVPLPAEFGTRFRLANPWRAALNIWVLSLLAAAGAMAHFLKPEEMQPALVLAVGLAVAIAWGLYFLARRTDVSQQR